MVRVRFTNAYGAAPLQIGRATVAIHARGPHLVPGTTRSLTFGGQQSVTIPPGADALSDPVRLAVRAMQELAVSEFLPRPTGPPTEHGAAQQFNYVASGDHTADSAGGAFNTRLETWYLIDDVDVLAPPRETGTIVAIGDSITDGVGSSVGANARWPNDLARRLLSRPGADALAHAGVKAVILLEGVNDIGFSQSIGWLTAPHSNVSAAQIIAGYAQMIAQAHAAGVPILGATLTPFRGARYWTSSGEAKREEVNHWILTSGAFDRVIDFAKAVADPDHPDQLAHRYDSGDHLHPNDAGYRAMAAAINLGALMRAR